MDRRILILNRETNFRQSMSGWEKMHGVWGLVLFFSLFGLSTFAVRRAPGVGQVHLGQDGKRDDTDDTTGLLRGTRRDEKNTSCILLCKTNDTRSYSCFMIVLSLDGRISCDRFARCQ
jgi:hypothetical protein